MATAPRLDLFEVAELGSRLRDNISRAVKAPDQVVRDLIVALLAEGHVLIEDAPGVGKTALARSLARSLEAEYARVQCTSDLLPADLVGTNVFNQRTSTFEFHPGPVFANVVLVDEINRASPKTQSGLLECMQERQITIDGHKHELALPFVVLATQNPTEYEGTYPLPEAELDRFMVRVTLGYPDAWDESAMLAEHADRDPVEELAPVADVSGVRGAQAALSGIEGTEPLRRYVVAICDATRRDRAGRARRQPARRADALSRGQGAGGARGARPRPPRRRPGARALRPLPPPAPLLRGRWRPARGGDPRGDRPRPRALMDRSKESAAPRAPATAGLGLVFLLVGIGFGLTAAIVCGIALLGLALGAVGWVELSTLRGRLERVSGPGRIEESEAYPLRIRLRHTLRPSPGR